MTTKFGDRLDLTNAPQSADAPAASFRSILFALFENDSGNGAVYVRGQVGSDIRFEFRLGAGHSGAIPLDVVVGSGTLRFSAATDAGFTTAPATPVSCTPLWER